MSSLDFKQLVDTVQHNCDIADANHAGDYTLCVYLLKMREYYRWVESKSFQDSLCKNDIGRWLSAKEAQWETLAEADYKNLVVQSHEFDPLDSSTINAQLLSHNLVYSGGFGARGQPHFFLGSLLRQEQHFGMQILVSDHEYARDLAAPPAYTLNNTIFIRRESLRRMIFEKIEEWRWSETNPAMSRAMNLYHDNVQTERALDQITDNELESVLLHEIGEINASKLLGEQWEDMIASLPRSQAELMARAVRDHIADCLSTLPSLLARKQPATLHFYFGNFRTMRKTLFPSLMLAYDTWVKEDSLEPVEATLKQGCDHWRSVAQEMLSVYNRFGTQSAPHIEALVKQNIL